MEINYKALLKKKFNATAEEIKAKNDNTIWIAYSYLKVQMQDKCKDADQYDEELQKIIKLLGV